MLRRENPLSHSAPLRHAPTAPPLVCGPFCAQPWLCKRACAPQSTASPTQVRIAASCRVPCMRGSHCGRLPALQTATRCVPLSPPPLPPAAAACASKGRLADAAPRPRVRCMPPSHLPPHAAAGGAPRPLCRPVRVARRAVQASAEPPSGHPSLGAWEQIKLARRWEPFQRLFGGRAAGRVAACSGRSPRPTPQALLCTQQGTLHRPPVPCPLRALLQEAGGGGG